MSVDVVTEIEIERPVAVVSAFASDPDNAPRWYVNIHSVEWKSERRLEVGAKIAFVARFLGRRIAYTYEIRELVPGERMVMSTAEGPFPMQTKYTFEPSPKGTRMTLRNRGEPTGFGAIAAPLMSRAMRRANQADLLALKKLLESS